MDECFFETWCLTLALKQGPRVCLVTDNKRITTIALFDYFLSCDLHRERPQSGLLPLVPCFASAAQVARDRHHCGDRSARYTTPLQCTSTTSNAEYVSQAASYIA